MDRKTRVLVVEDEAIIASDIQMRLQDLGYDVPFIVATGKEAIKKARESGPDLVLMDIMLNGDMDGIEAARQIVSENDIPIIYLSAYTDTMLNERAKDTRPHGYLSKPVSSYDLHNIIEVALYKHNAEKKLLEEKEFTEKAIDAQMDTFFVFDPSTGKALRWNKRFREVSGYTDEEIALMKAPESYYSPEDLKKAAVVIEEVIGRGQGKVQISLICKDGTRVPTEYVVSAIKDEKSNLKYIISIGRDITERKKAEDALEASRVILESIFEAVPDLLVVIDRSFRIIYTNHKGHDLVPKPDEDNAGTCYGRFKCLDAPCEDCSAMPVFETGETVEREMVNPADGRTREVRAFPIRNADNEVIYVVEYVRDITDLRKVDQ